MTRLAYGALALMAALLLPACGRPRNAAESSIAAAQTAYDRIREEAMNVAPDRALAIEDAIAAAREEVKSGSFKEALEATKHLPSEVDALHEALSDMRADLQADWEGIQATLPAVLASLNRELRPTTRGRMTGADFQGAVTELYQLKTMWAEAVSAERSGKLAEAVMKAEAANAGAAQLAAAVYSGS